jgi:hypothetical protein
VRTATFLSSSTSQNYNKTHNWLPTEKEKRTPKSSYPFSKLKKKKKKKNPHLKINRQTCYAHKVFVLIIRPKPKLKIPPQEVLQLTKLEKKIPPKTLMVHPPPTYSQTLTKPKWPKLITLI